MGGCHAQTAEERSAMRSSVGKDRLREVEEMIGFRLIARSYPGFAMLIANHVPTLIPYGT